MHNNALRVTFFAGLLLLAGGFPAGAATMICVTIQGSVQGDFLGDHPVSLCTDQIEALEFHHLVDADDAGTLQHRTVIFTKPIDRATVKLWRAWDSRERLTAAFMFYKPDGGGQVVHYHTVTLTNAVPAAIEPYVADVLDPEVNLWAPSERIRLSYDQMTVEYAIGGATVVLDNPAP